MPAASATAAAATPTRVARVAEGAGRLLGRLDLLTARIRPWMVLVPLALLGYGVAGLGRLEGRAHGLALLQRAATAPGTTRPPGCSGTA